MTTVPLREAAAELDRRDELAPFRDRFVIDDPRLVYLDGNSLGRLPKDTRVLLTRLVDRDWGHELIRGWGHGWFTAPRRIGAKMARLLGAGGDEVVMADSTTVNLFKLVVAALGARPDRPGVVTDDGNFPSDVYAIGSAMRCAGGERELRVVANSRRDGADEDALLSAIDGRTALVTLSHVLFKSGFIYDMARVTARAHEAGALVLWDLSHAAGAIPVDLNGAAADLAVGCSYKYLNGGPGAPAFLYVRRDLQGGLDNPIAGWFGQHRQFDFSLDYRPAAGITRFLSGTPMMASLAGVEPGLDLLLEAGLDRVRAKSVAQTEFLIRLYDEMLAPRGFTLNSPREAARRGSHVSIGHTEGLRIDRALIEEMDVLPDFRAPDNIRLGVAPLYTSFAELYEGVERIAAVVDERRYERYPLEAPEVT
jgi:kynureninase